MAMDFISGPTTTTNAAAAAAAAAAATIPRSPDSDTDTPPHPPPSKRAHQHHQVISSDNNSTVHVSYKECLKNHAASIGGHALDGCCEFMPGPTMNPMDPTSLTCAACGCHRNFHRRDPDDPTPLHHLIPPSAVARKPHSPPSASHLLLSLSGHTHSPSAPSDHDVIHTPAAVTSANNGTSAPPAAVMGFYNNNGGGGGGANSGGQNGNFQSRKRFRTKFTQEQKEKMYEFSEKIGWKLKKGEEKLVEDFCKQVGVDRTVFKVWMHNNKHSSSTSATTTPTPTTATPLTPISSSLNKLHKTTTSSSTTTPTTTTFNGNLEEKTNNNSSSNNNNNNNSGNVGMNCGGMLGVGSAHLDFNFANAGAQEAKAQ